MTTEKTLEKVLEIKTAEAARDLLIDNLITELKADLLKESAKKNGIAGKKKAADNILKQLKHHSNNGGAITAADGSQIIGGAYSLVKLIEPLPVMPCKNTNGLPDYIYCLNNARENNGAAVNLPTIAELTAYIKERKAEKVKHISYDFGEGLPLVNAQYLLEIITLIPDAACITSKKSPLTSALYFKSAAGEGLLLPERKRG